MDELPSIIQSILVSLGFFALGYSFRIYMERTLKIKSDSIFRKKITEDNWAKVFTDSGINDESIQNWHRRLKDQYPSVFRVLSKSIDFSSIGIEK